MSERREYPRISEDCVVEAHPVSCEDPELDRLTGPRGLLQNISGGGACLVLDQQHEAGQSLALRIHLPGFQSPVIAMARVAWQNSRPDGRTETGVEFWWVGWQSQDAQEEIRNFLDSRLSDGNQSRPSTSS